MPSIRRAIAKCLREIIESTTATPGERLQACKLLLKNMALGTKGKPRGRAFAKKVNGRANHQREGIEALLARIQS
jgi:hypothetical protein